MDDKRPDLSFMIRPCLLYREEYKDCTSIKARFHQRFVHGSFIDCSQWSRDYESCLKWKDKQDEKAYHDLLKSEVARRKERLDAHYGNDIWEKRITPPEEWNAPLPTWLEEKISNSYLRLRAANKSESPLNESNFCAIS